MSSPPLCNGTEMSLCSKYENYFIHEKVHPGASTEQLETLHSIHTFTMIVEMCAAGGILTIVMYGNKYIYNVKMG